MSVNPQKQGSNGRGHAPGSAVSQFKPGQSGNPGGSYRNTPKVSNAYAWLLAASPDQIAAFEPKNGAEIIAFEQFKNAQKGKPKEQLGAVREITDRTEGRAPQRIIVDNTSELERLIIRVQERVLAQAGIEMSREQAIEQIVSYRPELAESLE